MSKYPLPEGAKAVKPSEHARYEQLTVITPEIAEVLSTALQLANVALKRLRANGRPWDEHAFKCALYEEGGFRFGCFSQLPFIPSAVGASEPYIPPKGSSSFPLFWNEVVIATADETLLQIGWQLEGQFSVSWFKRGEWEQQLLTTARSVDESGKAAGRNAESGNG